MDTMYMGKIVKYNGLDNEITIGIEFITPEDIYYIEQLIKEGEVHKFTHKLARTGGKSYKLQKAYYGSLSLILTSQGIDASSSNMQYFDESIRRELFPAKELVMEDKIIHAPKRMRDMTHEELFDRIIRLQERYDHVNWDGFWEKNKI